jgi:hypothetical protein
MVTKSSFTSRRRAPARSQLRVADLKQRIPTASRAMNFRVPETVADAIDQLVDELDATKTNVIIALLNAGLDITAKRVPGLRRLR